MQIGFVVNTAMKPARAVMLGWLQHMRVRKSVTPRFFFASPATCASNLAKFAASGVDALVFCAVRREIVLKFLKEKHPRIPVVLCLNSKLPPEEARLLKDGGQVVMDNEAIGRQVGELFRAHGLASFAFFACNHYREKIVGECRCAAFRETVLGGKGNAERQFRTLYFGECMPNEDSWDISPEKLEKWIRELPLPCGVFANSDRSALLLVETCKRIGIDIPKQVEIVGVNNSRGLCESTTPAISSVQPDLNECARLSVDMAIALAEGRRLGGGPIVQVSSHILQERDSTLSGRGHGHIATRAKTFICKNACSGISVVDVAHHLGISRRTLEVRVKYATGKSVMSLIRGVRFENICNLLATTDLSISEVIVQSGYNLTTNVGALFKKTYGMTMRQYRVVHRSK